MKLIVIESPYHGRTERETGRNIQYARKCLLDSLRRGEAPIASHLLHTQVLNDNDPEERKLGMEAGFAWNIHANYVVVYIDLGISSGMKEGMRLAEQHNIPIKIRTLEKPHAKHKPKHKKRHKRS